MTDSILPLIAPYLAARVSRAMLKPWHPHRLLTMTPEPLAARVKRVHALWERSTISNHTFFATFIGDICGSALTRTSQDAGFDPLVEFVADLYVQNNLYLPRFPHFDLTRSLTAVEVMLAERRLIELEAICQNEDRIQAAFHDSACALLRDLDDLIPRGPGSALFQVPLHALLEPAGQSAQRWLLTFLTALPENRDAITCLAFSETANQLWLNLCAASGLAPGQLEEHPNRIKAPVDSRAAPEDIIVTGSGKLTRAAPRI